MKPDQIKQTIRERHSLDAETPVTIKALPATLKADDADDHVFSARINTAGLDRDDEVVLPRGMMDDEFKSAGSIFWNHDYNQPVGFAGKLARDDGAVIASGNTFMRRPADYKGDFFPDFVRAFVSQGAALGKAVGVSVGFIPMEERKPTAKDKETFGERIRNVITRWKLLEFSIAPVQSNPEAVVTTVGKALGAKACKALFGIEPPARKVYSFPIDVTPKRRKPSLQQVVANTVAIETAKRRGDLVVAVPYPEAL